MERRNPTYQASDLLGDFCDALGGLLRDLKRNEANGMHAATCEKISIALYDMTVGVNGIPNVNKAKPLWKLFEHFHNNFQSWAEIPGSNSSSINERRRYCEKLLHNRQVIIDALDESKWVLVCNVLKKPVVILLGLVLRGYIDNDRCE